ncbi:hypothetical protein [Croceicoccus sp. BE223]|uniref:hypothetical protein n=1 Tax=Croceicoccus sp. BE223 TaxID=2817716 RepID=UPI0028550376|nr:hypothetical protein [Croceicoccus sp. BE223]MDR7102888.1 hypothetical protein [Croceicoccus sp. BE223]
MNLTSGVVAEVVDLSQHRMSGVTIPSVLSTAQQTKCCEEPDADQQDGLVRHHHVHSSPSAEEDLAFARGW